MIEIWKSIEGYEGIYEISSLGRVKSLSREKIMPNGTICFTKEKILKQNRNINGYISISLYKNNKCHAFRIHRLVAKAFIENPNKFSEVNHKDENKENNKYINLEWCDKTYNNNYGTKKQRQIDTRSKTIYQYDINGYLIREWNNISEASNKGYSRECIYKCAIGSNIIHKDSFWSYEKHNKEYFIEKLNKKLNKRKIIQYDLDGNFIKIWESVNQIHNELGYDKSCISECLNNKRKYTHNSIFKKFNDINKFK